MGIFSSLTNAAVQANEDAHGDRLLKGVISSKAKIYALHNTGGAEMQIANAAQSGFIEITKQLEINMKNWSREGRLQKAKMLQEHARAIYDLNMAEAHAHWMAGAWLECGERHSLKAKIAFEKLDDFR